MRDMEYGKMKKRSGLQRFLAVGLSGVLLLSPVSPLGRAVTEEAHGAEWAMSYMNQLVSKGVMTGDTDGSLYPNRNITRAEFVSMVNRAFGFTEKGKTKFSDVPSTAWYADAISIAANQGYFVGIAPGEAAPEKVLTREQAVTLLCNAVKIQQKSQGISQFVDERQFSNWSKGNIYAATDKGFVKGFPNHTFRPGIPITRGEVSAMLVNIAGEIVNESRQARFGYVSGNVTLTKSEAGLRNTVIAGDLYITSGVGTGSIVLDGVTVLGEVIITGCGESNKGESSILLNDCDFKNMIVNIAGKDKKLSVIAEGNTRVDNTVIKSNTFLEERNRKSYAFTDIQMDGPQKTTLDLAGEFDAVRIMAPENYLNLQKGSIESLLVDEAAPKSKVFLEKNTYTDQLFCDVATSVTGPGKIDSVVINTNGTKIEGLPEDITIRPGNIANINGKDMTSEEAEIDRRDPEIEGNYPKIEEITATGANALLMTNKPGKLYWMVKAHAVTAPTVEELIAPKKATGVIQSGVANTATEKETSVKLTGLKSGLAYTFYGVFVDTRDKHSYREEVSFSTADNVIPAMISSYPKAEGFYEEVGTVPHHKLKFDLVATKNATVYWAVLPEKSVAPSAEMLLTNPMKVPGAVAMGSVPCSTNEPLTFMADGLSEATPYDAYMILKDSSANQSAVFKLSASTKDVTSPEFYEKQGYPMVGTVSEQNVQIKFMTDESCTIYWVAYDRDQKMPPGTMATPPAFGNPLYSPEAQQAVINGNTAISKGQTAAVKDKEGSLSITGLKVQTPYDLYYVLEDKAGNRSLPVLKQPITTKDNIAPEAKLAFDPAQVSLAGEPPVGSDIRMEFSEIVYDGKAVTRTPLSAASADRKKDMIRLYNVSLNPRMPVDIDFSRATFTVEAGKTVLTFTTGDDKSTNAAVKLASGNKYLFELKDIGDETGNGMKTNAQGNLTRLPEFKTMAPFVNLKDIGAAPSYADDFVFQAEPKVKNAAADFCYDTVLEVSEKVVFDITLTDEKGHQETASSLRMNPGRYYSLRSLMDGTLYTTYGAFNDLSKTNYAIRLTELGGVTNRTLWDQPVTITARGIGGTTSDLVAAAANGQNGTFDSQLTSLKATVVTDPAKLPCTKYFNDTAAPVWATNYPMAIPGDTSVQLAYQTDKPCQIHWLIAKKGDVTTTPNAIQLINGAVKPAGSKRDTFTIDNGNVVFKQIVRDLDARVDYEFYYTAAKGSGTSPVGMVPFTTKEVTQPKYAMGYPSKGSPGSGDVSLEMGITEDADADVYWVAYEAGAYDINPGSGKEITAAQIVGVGNNPGIRVVDYGQLLIRAGKKATVKVKNLKADRAYDVFFTMKNPMAGADDKNWTKVAAVTGIISADSTDPAIAEFTTTIISTSGGIMPTYEGTLSVTFTEQLYYLKELGGVRKPLTKAILAYELKASASPATITILNAPTLGDDGAITGFSLKFEGVRGNSPMTFPDYIEDSSGNRAGKLYMKFVTDKVNPEDSAWKVEFKK